MPITVRDDLIARRFSRMHVIVLLITLLLCGIGVAMLYSAAQGNMDPWASAHLKRVLIGFFLIMVISVFPIRFWFHYAYFIYGVGLTLLVAVEVMGFIGMGAKRWISIGGFSLQPSEFMKIALILALARYFHNLHLNNLHKLSMLIPPLVLIALPVLLILKQPNLGTATITAALSGFILFAAGVRIRIFVIAGMILLAAVPVVWNNLHDYQKRRVDTFLNPEKDRQGAGYNIIQSKIAFGSGGLIGKGFTEGTQSQLDFLPEKQTDFIFTMYAEEFGFVGAMTLLLMFALLLFQGLTIATNAHSQFAKIVAFGVTSMLFLHIFINMAMTMGLIPVVGVPLPFLSYGGSNLLAMLIGIGFLQNVSVHGHVKLPRALA